MEAGRAGKKARKSLIHSVVVSAMFESANMMAKVLLVLHQLWHWFKVKLPCVYPMEKLPGVISVWSALREWFDGLPGVGMVVLGTKYILSEKWTL